MQFFGEKLDAPVYESGEQVPTPVGRDCYYCGTAIVAGDNGFALPSLTPGEATRTFLAGGEITVGYDVIHRLCMLRSVLGPAADALVER